MFRKKREIPGPSAWEQMELAKQQARSEIAGEFLAMCVKMDRGVLESFIDHEAAKGKAFTGSASDVFFLDLCKILFAFVQANGSATEGLGDIFYMIAPLISNGVSAMTSPTIAVHFLNQLSVDHADNEPSVPQSLYCLRLFDEKHGTNYVSQAVRVYLKLVSTASEQGTSKFTQANGIVEDRYIGLLRSFEQSDPARASAHTPGDTNSGETGPAASGDSASEAYEILGVASTCSDKELKTAYHTKAAYWHPDKFHSRDIPKEMKEMATRKMARVNAAYRSLEKLRSTPTPSKVDETHRNQSSDMPKRDDPSAGGKTGNVPRPKSNHNDSNDPQTGIDGDASIKDSEGEYDMTGRPVRSEQEQFYKTVNRVVEDHATEIQLGLAYGKYRFWKAIFNSKPGQFIVLVLLAGICWIFGSDYGAKIILTSMITTIVWIVLTIVVGVIGGAIAGWKNPGGEHERTKVGFGATLFIWIVVFLFLSFALNKSPEEVGTNRPSEIQQTTPEQAPTQPSSTLPEPSSSDPATASSSDGPQAAEPAPALDTGQNASVGTLPPQGNATDSAPPMENTEKGFQACVRFSGAAYEDCMKPYR